jgi:DNA-binding transcriptional LysR family regulator
MNFRTLDLNLLRVFDVVMVERNVTRAAARLSMTQPAVSNALRRLRDAVGEDLFVPGATGVTPTAHAQAVWPAVRSAMDGLRGVFDPQDFDPTRDEHDFTLCMADATADVLMPAVLRVLERDRWRISMRVLALTTRDPRPQIEQGHADIALGFFPDVAAALASEGGSGMTVLDDLYACEYVCVMRRDHPLAQEAELSLDGYCSARHLRVNFAGRPHGFVDEALARLGRRRRVVLTLNQFSTAGRVVRESDLLTVLPRSYVPATGLADELTIRAFPCALPRIEVAMLWHRRHERDAAQRWLRSTMTRVAHDHVARTAA